MTKNLLRTLLFFFVLCWFSTASEAHRPDETYVYLRVYESHITGRVELPVSGINDVFGLEKNKKKGLEGFTELIPQLRNYILEHLSFRSASGSHDIVFEEEGFRRAFSGFVLFNFKLDNLNEVPDELLIKNSLVVHQSSSHHAEVIIEYNWKAGILDNESLPSLIYSQGDGEMALNLADRSLFTGFMNLVELGIEHIWIGIDHILFLLALLIPSVVVFSDPREMKKYGFVSYTSFQPVESFKSAFWVVLKVITLFTVAHTITLSLAALNVINLPSRLVESVIAISIALAAIHNIYPVIKGRVWLIPFVFGLFHGFGFASILAEKAMRGEFLGLSLFGFNLGVEIGQVVIIAIMFPCLYLLRKSKYYSSVVVVGSIFLIFISLYWMVERAFDIDLPLGRVIFQFLGLK